MRHGEELPQKKTIAPTFGDLWGKYEKWAAVNRKSFVAETNWCAKHLKPAVEKVLVSEISLFLLEKIKHDILKAGLSNQAVKHVLVLIRQVLNYAVSLGLWHGANPVKRVKIPRPNYKRERFLSREEAERLAQ